VGRTIADHLAQSLAKECSHFVELVTSREQFPRVLEPARRRDDAPGSNSIHAETPGLPLVFGPAPLPEAERSLGAAPRCAARVRPPRAASITSSR